MLIHLQEDTRSVHDIPMESDDSSLVWNLKNDKKFDDTASSDQNSILKKGDGRTFLFQTENLSFDIDFLGQKL